MQRRHEGNARKSRGIPGEMPLREQDRREKDEGENVKKENRERIVAPALLRVGLKPEGLEEPPIGGRDAGGGAPLREGQQPKSQESRQKSERQEKEEEEFERVEHDSIP